MARTPFSAAIGVAVLVLLTSGASAKTIAVAIGGLAFEPAVIAAEVGDTIVWTNSDFVDHTATAVDGSWDVSIPKGSTASVVLDEPGRLDYFCRYHPNMRGRIDVSAR